jgi:hypothetical protein
MGSRFELAVERSEQVAVELVRERNVVGVSDQLPLLDRRNRLPQRIDLAVELVCSEPELDGPRGRRGGEDRIDVVVDDCHPVVGLAWAKRFLEFGKRDDFARDSAIAGKAGQCRLGRNRLLLRLLEVGAERSSPGDVRRRGIRQLLEARELNPVLLDLHG